MHFQLKNILHHNTKHKLNIFNINKYLKYYFQNSKMRSKKTNF